MHVHTYFDRKSHCAHYLLFLIYIIENNERNECNSKTKGNAVKHNVKKFGYCGEECHKILRTSKNILFHSLLFLIVYNKKTICI